MKATICTLSLFLVFRSCSAALALERPKSDCPTPYLEKVNEANVWPAEYQIRSISEPVLDAEKLSTTVWAGIAFAAVPRIWLISV
jgi:hypothetical protein